MAKNKFNILNARITFKNVPVHKITNYSFKDISTASESFKKINGVSECMIIQTASRVEIFLVSKSEYFAVEKIKEVWTSLTELEQIDYKQIRKIFLQPEIQDIGKIEFKDTDYSGIVDYLANERSFSQERVQSSLNRLKKSLEKRSHTLDQWFK